VCVLWSGHAALFKGRRVGEIVHLIFKHHQHGNHTSLTSSDVADQGHNASVLFSPRFATPVACLLAITTTVVWCARVSSAAARPAMR